ncbi:GntR family transcriptional regulator [Herbiconiux sp. VKM Ac-2851]|uniref:GntR family transcriptional regulator n=1 Tax=Herbiconiux sp. VKM Ac-2851 TaxID=2739025 RepID=UPI0015669023|nr:GntR family transcriptional regulator [Herbiconiux sp. VKM Ac-2851]NQX35728.1 GntR family transcriptional regulator [Herbiconiux sp. VKM Ac-2851]
MAATTQFGPVGTTSRTSHVLEILKSAILNGQLEPGEALVEAELAGRLGVSKTPVREALKTLEGTGLVVIRPYTGAIVRVFSDDDAVAIYDMRLLLEPEAVRRSIASGADLTGAADALARAAAAESGSERSMANREFHRALYRHSGNPLLLQTLDGLRDQIALISAGSWARSASWQREAEEHARILEVAQAGDSEGAARLVREHIADFARRHVVPAEHPTPEGGSA